MTILLVGFDSAWTATNAGSILSVSRSDDGSFSDFNVPQSVNYKNAERKVLDWQEELKPQATIIFLDQPTIVKNRTGQRPVENLVSSPVSRRCGGMQPANLSRSEMFGPDAPMWAFLTRFGGPANPLGPLSSTSVLETYPVLTMIALGWTQTDARATGRLPKYNPTRKTFSIADWRCVCRLAAAEFRERKLSRIAIWLDKAAELEKPRKTDQDGLDSCVCLLAALYFVEERECLMVGSLDSGYIVVPYSLSLSEEIETRCERTDRASSEWVRSFRLEATTWRLSDNSYNTGSYQMKPRASRPGR